MADASAIAAKLQSVHFVAAQHAFLVTLCQAYQRSAQTAIGTYRFGWKPLAASTLAKKSANTPLLETGELRDSIAYVVSGGSDADVGTSHRVAVWQEGGTSRIPARPFMGGALGEVDKQVNGLISHMLDQAFR